MRGSEAPRGDQLRGGHISFHLSRLVASIMKNVDDAFLRKVIKIDPIPADELIALMSIVREIEPEFATEADRLAPGASLYLHSFQVRQLVEDYISISEARREIEIQKSFFSRMQNLLPTVFSLHKFPGVSDVVGFVRLIDDAHFDFAGVRNAKRQDRALRDTLREIDHTKDALDKAQTALSKSKKYFDGDFERAWSYHTRKLQNQHRNDQNRRSIESLINDMKFCSGAIEILKMRLEKGENLSIISKSGLSSFIVEQAASLAEHWNGPKITTTPGSDFANLCSLINEIVSGNEERSLAGAINRHFGSKGKIEHLDEQEEFEKSLDQNDNFMSQKIDLFRGIQDLMRLNELDAMEHASLEAQISYLNFHEEAFDRCKIALETYGPNLVWAHQFPAAMEEDRSKQAEKLRAESVRLSIELGRLRRTMPRGSRP